MRDAHRGGWDYPHPLHPGAPGARLAQLEAELGAALAPPADGSRVDLKRVRRAANTVYDEHRRLEYGGSS
ncbi:hypothetical protein [Nocardioides sp.]|uniref:hypothetical protein n=1 Tax=Nocardioides sp. TaxID=35761 RepID=UPI002617B82D|nr:hypothetical protein [Nocardioides sp.]MDI6908644.1 hypothetical protein [Nocardioides sp.]